MRWAMIRIGRLQGVPVEIHWLVPLTVLWAAWQGFSVQAGPALALPPGNHLWLEAVQRGATGAAYGLATMLLLFGCVLLHEVGHTAQARALALPVRRIILLPFGGLAELVRMPHRPLEELRVALAGPLVNLGLGLAGGLLAWLTVIAGHQTLLGALQSSRFSLTLIGLLLYFALANLGLAVFNLLPAFPMDGGRILRAGLATLMDRGAATGVALLVGRVLAAVLLFISLFGLPPWKISPSPLYLFVAGFIFLGTGFEARSERNRQTLTRISAGEALRQPTWTLDPGDLLTPDLRNGAFTVQPVMPVVVDSRLIGLLALPDLMKALKHHPPQSAAHAMRTRFAAVQLSATLWDAQLALQESGLGALPVVEGNRLRGMLTPEDIFTASRRLPPAGPPQTATLLIPGGSSQP